MWEEDNLSYEQERMGGTVLNGHEEIKLRGQAQEDKDLDKSDNIIRIYSLWTY